jgi:hypothetical protein
MAREPIILSSAMSAEHVVLVICSLLKLHLHKDGIIMNGEKKSCNYILVIGQFYNCMFGVTIL